MQDSGCVFKVPRPRKRRQRLYCTENMSDLLEIWEADPKPEAVCWISCTSKPTSPRQYQSQSDRLNGVDMAEYSEQEVPEEASDFSSFPLTVGNDKYEETQGDKDDIFWCQSSKNKFSFALLREFSNSSDINSLTNRSHYFEQEGQFTQINLPHPAPESTPIYSPHDKEDNTISLANEIPKMSDLSPGSPDVLIVCDESMNCVDSPGSDLDWESLTPPAPRSPRDQMVPDHADFSTAIPGDFLLYVDPFSSTREDDINVPEDDSVVPSIAQHSVSRWGTDDVSPEFFM